MKQIGVLPKQTRRIRDGKGELVQRQPKKKRKRKLNRGSYRRSAPRFADHLDSTWVGIDGEGYGDAPHRYVYLCAADSAGNVLAELSDPHWMVGLRSVAILDFLCGLPSDRRYWAFSFGYDLALWLKDLSARLIYELARPDTRRTDHPTPHTRTWRGFKIQWNLTFFSVEDVAPWQRDPKFKRLATTAATTKTVAAINAIVANYKAQDRRKFQCWDIWKFFGCRFTKALEDWKVQVNIRDIEKMKAKRGEFQPEDRESVEAYCQAECAALGTLAHKLYNAHLDAGIELKSFFGAGSTAGAMLKEWGTKQFRGETPKYLQEPIASAFFGGRFENSRVGVVEGPLYAYDISSAYPYQCTRMPCFEHGRWVKVKTRKEIDAFKVALIRYRLNLGTFKGRKLKAWGPLPFRTKEKSIVYPAQSGGGWVWQDEYKATEKHFSGLEFMHAYCWEQQCDCKPFPGIPYMYTERVRIGKEGAGIIFKLGPNAVYGKIAQSKGKNPPYQQWGWAGLITSNTRAKMIDDAMNQLTDLDELLMIATDGCHLTRPLKMPAPEDTGTNDLKKPLGGWEAKNIPQGCFYARPGVYFPLRPTEDDIEQVRARGMGRATLYKQNRHLVNSWKRGEREIQFDSVRRFRGAVTSTAYVGETWKKRPDYGCWVEQKVSLSLSGLPKREDFASKDNRLALRRFSMSEVSLPYVRALTVEDLNPEHAALEEQKLIDAEQPDGET